jgi:hypothetical protein
MKPADFLKTHASFKELPTLQQWKAASTIPGSVNDPDRAADLSLQRIDWLVGALEGNVQGGEKPYLLSELFFSTMWWMNHRKDDPTGMRAIRRRSVLSLNLCAANKLASTLGCPINSLAHELQQIYGKQMDQYGYDTDEDNERLGGGTKKYLDAIQREKYRVLIIRGRAYQIRNGQRVPFHTISPMGKQYSDSEGRVGVIFVMSMSGELYAQPGFTHSYFMAGRPVLCAGTICANQGQITRLCNDSGHYQPVDSAMVKVLERLRGVGVDIRGITVGLEQFSRSIAKAHPNPMESEHPTRAEVNAVRFLEGYGNWQTILRSGTRGGVGASGDNKGSDGVR